MPKTQTKQNALRRLLSWYGRHKVLGTFSLLVVAGVLYFAVSTVIWNLQVRTERQQFMKTQNDMYSLTGDIQQLGDLSKRSYCFYASSPKEFVKGERFCVVRLSIVALSGTKDEARKTTLGIEASLQNHNLVPKNNSKSRNENTITLDDFKDGKQDCVFSAEFYTSQTPSDVRAWGAPKTGSALIGDIICSEPAKSEYFPVVKD